MRRSSVLLCALTLAASVGWGGAPASSTPAATTCQGVNEIITLSEGLYYPVILTKSNVSILPFNIGGCAGDGVLESASCGLSNGTVTVNDKQSLITTAGGAVYLWPLEPGGFAGVLSATPNVLGGESCASGAGADTFLITGAVSNEVSASYCVTQYYVDRDLMKFIDCVA